MAMVIRPLVNSVRWFNIEYFMLKATKSDKMCVFKKYSFRETQGLLYLDGRNSQKYLHQNQADF
jgi:hypothetical protein